MDSEPIRVGENAAAAAAARRQEKILVVSPFFPAPTRVYMYVAHSHMGFFPPSTPDSGRSLVIFGKVRPSSSSSPTFVSFPLGFARRSFLSGTKPKTCLTSRLQERRKGGNVSAEEKEFPPLSLPHFFPARQV